MTSVGKVDVPEPKNRDRIVTIDCNYQYVTALTIKGDPLLLQSAASS